MVGERAGAAAAERLGASARVAEIAPASLPRADRTALQQLMSAHASVVRDGDGLRGAMLRVLALMSDGEPEEVATQRESGPDTAGTAGDEPAAADSAVPAYTVAAHGISGDRPAGVLRAVEDAALTMTARALLVVAAGRAESRGCHTRSDCPDPRDELRRSIAIRLGADGRPQVVGEPVTAADPLPVGSVG